MQFNWSTFVLEIINFLVLVWILKRLLYFPVKKIIQQRKQIIQKSLEQVEQLKNAAQELKLKSAVELSVWEKEREQKKSLLELEIANLKTNLLDKLNETLAIEKEKIKANDLRKLQLEAEGNLRQAMSLATKFSAKFLTSFADADLEHKIVVFFIQDILHLPSEQLQKLSNELNDQMNIIQIQSAFPLDAIQLQAIENNLCQVLQRKINFEHSQNSELLAGLSLQIGSIVLQVNLHDELRFFAEVANGRTNL